MDHKCPLCNSENFVNIGNPEFNEISMNLIDRDYKVVKCLTCSAYFVDPQITFSDEQWSLLYNSEYFDDQSDWLVRKRVKELSARLNKIFSFSKSKTEKLKLLDIGTGEGKTLIEGYKRGWEVTGIDIVDNRIDLAKNDKITFIQGKFIETVFPDDYFDIIYVDSVLEHVLIPKEYLLKINRLLKPGGVVYIGVPNEDSLFNDIKKISLSISGNSILSSKIKPFKNPYHIFGFNRKSLEYVIKRTNFEILEISNFGRKFNFLGHKINQRGFWIGFFILFPLEFFSKFIGKDVYFEAYLTKAADK